MPDQPSPAPAEEPKSLFKSKTIVVNAVVVAVVALVPQAAVLVKTMPELTLAALGLLNIGLRFITKKRVALFPETAAKRPEYDDEDLYD